MYYHSHLLLGGAAHGTLLPQQGLVRQQQGLDLLRWWMGIWDPNRSRRASSSRRHSLIASSAKRECARIIVRGNNGERQKTDPIGPRRCVGEGVATRQSLRPRSGSRSGGRSSTPDWRSSTPESAQEARRAGSCGRTLFAHARDTRGERQCWLTVGTRKAWACRSGDGASKSWSSAKIIRSSVRDGLRRTQSRNRAAEGRSAYRCVWYYLGHCGGRSHVPWGSDASGRRQGSVVAVGHKDLQHMAD